MPTLQQMLDIAMRHATAMADAMVVACYEKAHELGVRLRAPAARPDAPARGQRPAEKADWERMVRRNSDTRRNHC